MRLILLGLAAIVAGGCDTRWNWANRGDLERDAVGFLRRHGMKAREPACHMVGLTAVEAPQPAGGCPGGAGSTTFRSGRRPAELRLPNASAFEYLLLRRGASGDRMYAQVEYAYG